MKAKHVVTTILLLFVLASVGYLLAQEFGKQDAETPEGATSAPAGAGPQDKVIAYYFHGGARCATCRKFETYTGEAITAAFPDELKAGTIEWRKVNTDEPSDEHFVKDFKLVSKAVVLVRIKDGKQTAWKKLDRIWDLVGDKAAYQAYVQGELKTFVATNE
jgi:hypothetical protein